LVKNLKFGQKSNNCWKIIIVFKNTNFGQTFQINQKSNFWSKIPPYLPFIIGFNWPKTSSWPRICSPSCSRFRSRIGRTNTKCPKIRKGWNARSTWPKSTCPKLPPRSDGNTNEPHFTAKSGKLVLKYSYS